jgi:HPt (histidine-containing phosphotransfer) domain-containing protein
VGAVSRGPGSAEDEHTKALIAEIWARMRPVVRARLDVLDEAAAAAEAGCLSDAARVEAESTAHKLAGSLGLYGLDAGSACARRIEHRLQVSRIGPDEEDVTLRALIADLRSSLDA